MSLRVVKGECCQENCNRWMSSDEVVCWVTWKKSRHGFPVEKYDDDDDDDDASDGEEEEDVEE